MAGPSAEPGPAGHQDFSIVQGGPLFAFLRSTRLCDDAMRLLHRRIAIWVLLTWAPLLVILELNGTLMAPAKVGFFDDVGFHLRFLVVGPLLITSELVVHRRLQPVIAQFRHRDLIRPHDAARFQDALDTAHRWRNSILAEVILLGLVYAGGLLFTIHRYRVLGEDAWYAPAEPGHPSLAGLWLVFVSLPLLQFLLLRWYYRLFVWAKFLWQMSRLDLQLNVTHPDRAGGLGFLADSLIAFMPVAAAHGALFAAMMATQIFFADARLTDFEVEVFGGTLFVLALFAGPLLVFTPLLALVKEKGLREFGAIGQTFAGEFRAKWFAGSPPADQSLVDGPDISSLCDLGGSFATAEQMRFVPIRPTAFAYFLVAFFAPILPLVLTMMSPEKLLERVVGLVF